MASFSEKQSLASNNEGTLQFGIIILFLFLVSWVTIDIVDIKFK